MLTSAQPSAMGGPSERVSATQIKPSAKGGKKGSAKDSKRNPVVNYPRALDEPKVQCLQGHEILLSRIPWQAGCNKCSGHNGWSPQIISQYYNQVLDQFPLPWHEAVSEHPYLQVGQFKGKRRALDDQIQQQKGKGPAQPQQVQPHLQEVQAPLKPQPPAYPPMFKGASQSMFEECCTQVANQLGEEQLKAEVLQDYQAQLDQWKLKLAAHILRHKERSEALQQEISARQAMIQAILDDSKELEKSLSEAGDWSHLLSEQLDKASQNKEKEKKIAKLLASLDCTGDEEEVLAMARSLVQERKDAARANTAKASPSRVPSAMDA